MWASPVLLVEREREKGKKENLFTPLPCTKAPEWNSYAGWGWGAGEIAL
jgi:hypothetical protein